MNSRPAATALRPAARVSVVVVMVMSGSLFQVRGGALRVDSKPRERWGDPASPNDVTEWVRSGSAAG